MSSWEDGFSLKRVLCPLGLKTNIWVQVSILTTNGLRMFTWVFMIVHSRAWNIFFLGGFSAGKRDVQVTAVFPHKGKREYIQAVKTTWHTFIGGWHVGKLHEESKFLDAWAAAHVCRHPHMIISSHTVYTHLYFLHRQMYKQYFIHKSKFKVGEFTPALIQEDSALKEVKRRRSQTNQIRSQIIFSLSAIQFVMLQGSWAVDRQPWSCTTYISDRTSWGGWIFIGLESTDIYKENAEYWQLLIRFKVRKFARSHQIEAPIQKCIFADVLPGWMMQGSHSLIALRQQGTA